MTGIITDTWPACACRGLSPQLLEHTFTHCAVIPEVLIQAMIEDRPLTDDELTAIDQASERSIRRGYRGGKIDPHAILDRHRDRVTDSE